MRNWFYSGDLPKMASLQRIKLLAMVSLLVEACKTSFSIQLFTDELAADRPWVLKYSDMTMPSVNGIPRFDIEIRRYFGSNLSISLHVVLRTIK